MILALLEFECLLHVLNLDVELCDLIYSGLQHVFGPRHKILEGFMSFFRLVFLSIQPLLTDLHPFLEGIHSPTLFLKLLHLSTVTTDSSFMGS